jgi:hypothetical protein
VGTALCAFAHPTLATSGAYSCPNDWGIVLRLEFYEQHTLVLAADYRPTGCASIKFTSGTNKDAMSGNFSTDLWKALGFSSEQQFLNLP